jgi:uncharacterized membrane protein YkvA (DUF1232 family)
VLRVPRYVQLTYHLVRDQRLTAAQRALVAAGAAYAISPIDPVPGIIPVFGQLDDLAVLLLSLRRVLRRCPDDLAQEHLEAVGLSLAQIDSDLRVVRATAIWAAVNLGRLVGHGLQLVGRAGARSARTALTDLLTRRRG